jgi:hypothetical protein
VRVIIDTLNLTNSISVFAVSLLIVLYECVILHLELNFRGNRD